MLTHTTIKGVASRTITRKKDGKTITIFEIEDTDGKTWTTSRRDVANEANRLINQSVEIQGRTEQNGTYVNHYLDDIRESQGNGHHYQPIQEAQHAQQYQQQPQMQPEIKPAGPTEKDWSIMRQTAGKVSALVSSNPSDFWNNLDWLVTYFATGLKPPEYENQASSGQFRQSQQQTQPQQSNQFIPAGSGGELDYSTDDDIPF